MKNNLIFIIFKQLLIFFLIIIKNTFSYKNNNKRNINFKKLKNLLGNLLIKI